ncbi:hypothetical protein [Sinorhizobium meliloti]|uniref:hypothetical protein n=1 Tax=Rhizobium meliloti TaxID=382 RepID=UPI0012956E65|nr:hypothetical protein [Sinorhizobium meliloti]MQX70104.1 hypothetical protein [Sinorhizobium meliloti]
MNAVDPVSYALNGAQQLRRALLKPSLGGECFGGMNAMLSQVGCGFISLILRNLHLALHAPPNARERAKDRDYEYDKFCGYGHRRPLIAAATD